MQSTFIPIRRHGFTLIELVLSLGVLGVLIVSMTSLMVLTSRAIPTSKDRDQQAVQVRDRLDSMDSDLSVATELSDVSATSITIKVPDRTGDTTSETITYAWSGTNGDPVTMSINAATPKAVLNSVASFTLELSTDIRDVSIVSGIEESSEQLLDSYAGPTDTSDKATALQLHAQCVLPVLDSDVIAWRLTRFVHTIYRNAGQLTNYTVTVHASNATGSLDTLSILGGATRFLGTANANQTVPQSFSFASLPWRSPNTSLWIAILPILPSAFEVPSQSKAPSTGYTAKGILSGPTKLWNIADYNGSYLYEAYGVVRRPKRITTQQTCGTQVRVTARMLSGDVVVINPRLWNLPEVK